MRKALESQITVLLVLALGAKDAHLVSPQHPEELQARTAHTRVNGHFLKDFNNHSFS